MKHRYAIVLAPAAALLLSSCIVEVPEDSGNNGAVSQVSNNSEIPRKVVNDCLATLRNQVGDKPMTVLSEKRGETSFIIDVKVEGAEKPWRCYHDGTKCTGTEYQGEG